MLVQHNVNLKQYTKRPRKLNEGQSTIKKIHKQALDNKFK